MKKIAFIFPGRGLNPIGGFKIAYQYADFFSECGYEVHLIFNYEKRDFFKTKNISLFHKIKSFIGFYYRKYRGDLELSNWYIFKNKIHKDIIFNYAPFFLNKYKNFYAIYATAVETAYFLNDVKSIKNINKFYLIQDFENWKGNTDEYVYNSYNFPFTKIVISKWLQKRVEKTGNNATLIPNGLDFNYFKLSVPIENRKATEIAMLYHLDNRKRCCDAMEALAIVKKQIPDLHVSIFGVPDKPIDLPDWYTYYQTPTKEKHNYIYNNAAIFVAASDKEGWGLTPCEAMQCGVAVACSNAEGFLEFAIDNENALVSPIYDNIALANNILKLINNNELRIKIATAGNQSIQQFTLESAFSKIKKLMEDTIDK